VETRRLKYFARVIEVGSLTRAAEHLHIAQPALSQQMAALEAEFGAKLLIRSKRGVVPTAAGHVLYRHAQLILRQVEQAQIEIANSLATLSGSVSVGLTVSAAAVLSLPLLRAARQRYPDITLHINESLSGFLADFVVNGRLDMALLSGDVPIKGLTHRALMVEQLFLLSSTNADGGASSVIQGSEDITIAALRGHPLLLPSRPHGLRKLVDAAFSQAGITPDVVAELDSLRSLVAAAEEGIGSTILPWSATAWVTRPILVHRFIEPGLARTITLCAPESLPLSSPAEAIHALLIEVVGSLAASQAWLGVTLLP
jgi:LysR family nitrogen assimilation transcriptional regulator